MAYIPPGVRCQGHTEIWQTDASSLVAVFIDCCHQVSIGFANLGRQSGRYALIHSCAKVQPGNVPQIRREVHLWQRLERGGCLLWEHCRAIIKTWMEGGRRSLARSDPTVQMHQGGAQQGPVVNRVGPVLPARVVCST